MVTAISIGFLNGIRGKTGFFFRTPKSGLEHVGDNKYFRDVQLDRIAIAETICDFGFGPQGSNSFPRCLVPSLVASRFWNPNPKINEPFPYA
jgi:hypothetical protein